MKNKLAIISFLLIAACMPLLNNIASASEPGIAGRLEPHIGNCETATMNGQPVKACRDKNGQYKILPADGVSVTIPANQMEEPVNISTTHQLGSFSVHRPPCYKDDVPGSTCFASKEAYEKNQRLKEINRRNAEEQAKEPTAEEKRLRGNYIRCLYRSFGRGEAGIISFQNCIDIGIALCNGDGMPTSKKYNVSSITGRVGLDNNQCGITLERIYEGAQSTFANEYENYSRSEAVGTPYSPIMFDLRKYVGQSGR